jgi:7-keto-8-aminopelargonate synthetase-like enzyme
VLSLSRHCKTLIRDFFGPSTVIYAPDIPSLSSGITTFNPFTDRTDLTTLNAFRDRLREEYGYIVRTTDFEITIGGGQEHALRISTHLFHNEQDVEGLVTAMHQLYREMV